MVLKGAVHVLCCTLCRGFNPCHVAESCHRVTVSSATLSGSSSAMTTATPAAVGTATGQLSHYRMLCCCCGGPGSGVVNGMPGHHHVGCCCWPFATCPKFTTYSAISLLGLSTFLLLQQKVELILTWLLDSGDAESFLLFLLLFTLLSFPMTWGYILVNVVAGYRFGLAFGTVVVVVCVAIGSGLALVVCRSLLAGWIQQRLLTDRLETIISIVEGRHGFSLIALTRLTPIPFGIQNGVFALSKVRVSTFMTASLIGLLPTQLLNSYMGSTLRSVQDVRDQKSSTALLLVQVLISVLLSVYVIRIAQRELHKRLDSHQQNSCHGDTTPQDLDKAHHASDMTVAGLHDNGIKAGVGIDAERRVHSNGTTVGDPFVV